MTHLRELIRRGTALLDEHGVPNARRNAEWILCDSLGCSVLELYTADHEPAPDDLERYWSRLRRRAAREPLQVILGATEFMSLPFAIPAGVFVPRPDTEVLVEAAERWLRARALDVPLRLLDLCCGSGVIGVSLAHRIPNLDVDAVDQSADAVETTAHNARRNGVDARVHVHNADASAFLAASHDHARCYTAIACNPPYIETAVIASLPPEVRDHDPAAALDGGSDGLDAYRALVPLLAPRLEPGGLAIFEIGDAQAGAVSGMLERERFADVRVIQDFGARDRVVAALAPTEERGRNG